MNKHREQARGVSDLRDSGSLQPFRCGKMVGAALDGKR